jgi:hypothetical protein
MGVTPLCVLGMGLASILGEPKNDRWLRNDWDNEKNKILDLIEFLFKNFTKDSQFDINVKNHVCGETIWHIFAKYDGAILERFLKLADSLELKPDLEIQYEICCYFNCSPLTSSFPSATSSQLRAIHKFCSSFYHCNMVQLLMIFVEITSEERHYL